MSQGKLENGDLGLRLHVIGHTLTYYVKHNYLLKESKAAWLWL